MESRRGGVVLCDLDHSFHFRFARKIYRATVNRSRRHEASGRASHGTFLKTLIRRSVQAVILLKFSKSQEIDLLMEEICFRKPGYQVCVSLFLP